MQPMDTRDLYDYKMQFIILGLLALSSICLLIGNTSLLSGHLSNRIYQDVITIGELESSIKKIREENSALLDELNSLTGGSTEKSEEH
jgi:hypothetical protein